MTAGSMRYDVAIVGGGPAGAAAALALRTFTPMQVAVVERSDYSQVRVGETVSSSMRPLLEYLGVWDAFQADEHLESYGTSAVWGSPGLFAQNFLFTGRGNGWHLNRARFDGMLAGAAAQRGGVMYRGAQMVGCGRAPGGDWELGLRFTDGVSAQLTAGFVIDASGQSAVVARRLGAEHQVFDRLMGVVGLLERDAGAEERQHYTLVEACEDGWWYSALLPGGRMVAAFMTDADAVRQERLEAPGNWWAKLQAAEQTAQFLAGARPCAEVHVRPAYSRTLSPAGGQGWVAAGDAAASFDPLASMGIGHAISSGIHAARVACDWVAGERELMEQYTANMAENFHRYLATRRQYYRMERRWLDAPFWARRHEEPVGAAIS